MVIEMIYVLIAAGIFLMDLVIKNHVEKSRGEGEDDYRLGGRLIFRKYHNRGAFLNAGERRRPLVAALSVALTLGLAAVFVLTLGTRGNTLLRCGLAVLLGGAFSNTYDRLRRKYVVDYVSFNVGKRLGRVVFNLSDFCIMIGALAAALGYKE